MDSHLQATLEMAVNRLSTNKTSTLHEVTMAPGYRDTVQGFFAPFQQDLSSLVQNRPAVRRVGCAASFEALDAYLERVRQELLPWVSAQTPS